LKEEKKKKKYTLLEYKLPPTALSFIWNSIHRMKIEKLIGKVDWVITSDWTEPPSHMKKATIVHDLVYLRYPSTLHPTIINNQKERLNGKKKNHVLFLQIQTQQRMI
jgi:hypothetical protein